jgi:hypothetical protein
MADPAGESKSAALRRVEDAGDLLLGAEGEVVVIDARDIEGFASEGEAGPGCGHKIGGARPPA